MKLSLRKIILRIYFVLLALAILNAIIKNITNYSLQETLAFGIKLLVVISGLRLFFFYLKPFKQINIYFSIYAIAGILLGLDLIFHGMVGALLIYLILFPIIPNEKVYDNNGFTISSPFQEFMASCCSYQLKERKFLLFEKDYGVFESQSGGPINAESIRIKQSNSEIEITYTTGFKDGIMKKKEIKR